MEGDCTEQWSKSPVPKVSICDLIFFFFNFKTLVSALIRIDMAIFIYTAIFHLLFKILEKSAVCVYLRLLSGIDLMYCHRI